MSKQAEQRIDLTGEGQSLRYVEILTDAGIVRVNVNLVDTRTRRRVVVVEVEPNGAYARTAAGGFWDTAVDKIGTRTDVRLIRRN